MGLKTAQLRLPTQQRSHSRYARFRQLDGSHPLQELLPNGCVLYQARQLKKGHVLYFNFVLAIEMGLIPADHNQKMDSELEQILIDTFCLQIINEFDKKNGKSFDPSTIKPHPYMATRYLQLQHEDKLGRTSGDGRAIWNGQVQYRGKVWDVSSRGTGVTCLAPGAVEAQKPLQTGSEEFGYGCGQAELDELVGAALMAEVLHHQGLSTERVLCVIDIGKNVGIGVRAAPSLIRPAHLFMYLKQNRLDELQKLLDLQISQQWKNGLLEKKPNYKQWLEEIAKKFAQFAAQLEVDYIFAWLDWDGDNVLLDAGVIDYGSIRQFGLRHDQYRYDDIERFSTNLNEQKNKTRMIVQTLAQSIDAIQTGKKKNLSDFRQNASCVLFDQEFQLAKKKRFLFRLGLEKDQILKVLGEDLLLTDFLNEFSYFEKAKISGTKRRVSDGINHPALFNMRKAILELSSHFASKGLESMGPQPDELFLKMLSQFARSKDARITSKQKGRLHNLTRLFKMVLVAAFGKNSPSKNLQELHRRAERLNREDRITGNALIHVVAELLRHHKKSDRKDDLQKLIDQLILSFVCDPDWSRKQGPQLKLRRLHLPQKHAELLALIESLSEEI